MVQSLYLLPVVSCCITSMNSSGFIVYNRCIVGNEKSRNQNHGMISHESRGIEEIRITLEEDGEWVKRERERDPN